MSVLRLVFVFIMDLAYWAYDLRFPTSCEAQGTPVNWDAENLKATNAPEADAFIRKTYREGWTLNG